MNNSTRGSKCHLGFTLIELLVVIAIIALLLSILMPALGRVKEAGKRAVCLSNVKSLTLGWMLYIQDNDGNLPSSEAKVYDGWVHLIPSFSGNPQDAPEDLQLKSLEEGLLYPYLETPDIYRCPIAKKEEYRTYSMTHALNGNPDSESFVGGTVLKKFGQIKTTANRIVFLDDYITDWDACWLVYNDQPKWWNTTPIRHGSGGNVFSFADGHSEFWRWEDERTVSLAEKCYELGTVDARTLADSVQEGNKDLIRVQKGVWGKLNY